MRTGASFRVHGVEAAAVTATLGLQPTSAPDEPWRLSVEPTNDTELSVPIQAILDSLDQVGAGLAKLRGDGARFDLFCYLGSHAAEHCAVLKPELLQRVADLPAELWLDVYKDD
jgi:hypothetical protein